MQQELVIVIPTYNRHGPLSNLLDRIIPQLTSSCRLIICDNASTDSTEQLAKAVIARSVSARIEYHKNPVNIGAVGNVLKAFSLAYPCWLWICSDDDTPCENAIAVIEDAAAKYQDFCFVNFNTNILRDFEKKTRAFPSAAMRDNFAQVCDSISNAVFISAGIYNTSRLRDSIRIGYVYGLSLVPHFMLVLDAITRCGEKAMFMPEHIAEFGQNGAIRADEGWDPRGGIRFLHILEVFENRKDQLLIYQKMKDTVWPFLDPSIKDQILANCIPENEVAKALLSRRREELGADYRWGVRRGALICAMSVMLDICCALAGRIFSLPVRLVMKYPPAARRIMRGMNTFDTRRIYTGRRM